MLEFEETLTPEEILLRFKKLFGRDMTSQEMGCFFFPCELTPDSAPDKKLARCQRHTRRSSGLLVGKAPTECNDGQ